MQVVLGIPIKVRGCAGKYVPFLVYRDIPEFRAVRADSEMGKLILQSVETGDRALLEPYKTRIWNESRLFAVNEIVEGK